MRKDLGLQLLKTIQVTWRLVGNREVMQVHRTDQYGQVGFSPAIGRLLLGRLN